MKYYSKHFSVILPVVMIFFICTDVLFAKNKGKSIDITNPPQGVFYEQYYAIYLSNIKCGCARFQSERSGNKIITRSKMILKLGRANFKFQCSIFTKAIETIAGKPIRYKEEISLGNYKSAYDCIFTPNSFTVKITQNNQSAIRKFPPLTNIKLAWAEHLATLPYLKKSGMTLTINTYDPQINLAKPAVTEYTIVGPVQITFNGKTIKGTKIIATIKNLQANNSSIAIVDDENNPLFTEIAIGTFKVQMIATDKKDAISGLITKDIFAQSLIELKQPLELTGKCLKLKISSIDGSKLAPLPETSMQKVIAKGDNWQILKICSGEQKKTKNQQTPDRKYLADSNYVNLRDPGLIALANRASRGKTNPTAIAQSLCMFVHNYITTKDLSSVFDTASHIARTKTGDCSEHSVLLASLARIKKIPSRVVTGLVYSPKIGKFGGFGYHMWVQLWINGSWRDFDPTFGQLHPDPTHIAIATSDLANGTLTIDNAKLAEYMGRIKIEIADD